MKTLLIALGICLNFASCSRQDSLKVVLTRFPNNSIKEVIYYDLPITSDSVGKKEIYFVNGALQATGNYKNGKRNGKWVCYRQNGQLEWRADYHDGIENGITECFEENGSWRKMTFVNGCKNGPTIEFNTDSINRQYWVYGQYKKCKQDGLWVWKNKEQEVTAKEFYTDGKPDKFYESYFTNGKIYRKAFLSLGDVDSLQTFDSTGKLLETRYFKNAVISY